jgi:hypothetical protein
MKEEQGAPFTAPLVPMQTITSSGCDRDVQEKTVIFSCHLMIRIASFAL